MSNVHGRMTGLTAEQALVSAGLFGPAEASKLTAEPDTGSCQQMTNLITERGHGARSAEPAEWP